MKILQINKFFYIKGGPESCMFNTAETLTQKGHEVAFFSMHHPKNFDSEWQRYFVSYTEYNKRHSIREKVHLFFKTLYSKEATRELERLISVFKPEVAHIHNFNHQLTPSILFVLRKRKIPVVITLHDYKLVCPSYSMVVHGVVCELCKGGKFFSCVKTKCVKDSLSNSFLASIESYLHHKILKSYKMVDCFISPSRFLINKYKEMGLSGEYYHIPNFIDVGKFQPLYSSESNEIAFCGKLSEEKGIRSLISSVKGSQVTLNVLGDGFLKEELSEYISTQGIKNVFLLGHLNGDVLFNRIRESLFLVLPSEWYENNPYVILEAFALGKPVIGSKIGGIPELVKDGITGLTFEPGNVEDLRNKIEYMLSHKEEVVEMGRNARKLIEDEFNDEKYYGRLMEIYTQLVR